VGVNKVGGTLMDAGTMKDYIEDLIQQVNTLEAQFHKLNEVIVQLQQQRDQYRALYEATQK
jgi:flagellar capping protein FliD